MYGPPAVWTKLPQDPSGASRSEGSSQRTRGVNSPQRAGACEGTGPAARPCRGDRGSKKRLCELSQTQEPDSLAIPETMLKGTSTCGSCTGRRLHSPCSIARSVGYFGVL